MRGLRLPGDGQRCATASRRSPCRYAAEVVALEPFSETGYQSLMRLHFARATVPRRCASSAAAATCCATSLGTSPSPQTEACSWRFFARRPLINRAPMPLTHSPLNQNDPGHEDAPDRRRRSGSPPGRHGSGTAEAVDAAGALAPSRHSLPVADLARRRQLRQGPLLGGVRLGPRRWRRCAENSAYFLMTEPDRKKPVTADVDRQAKRVRVTVEGVTRTAALLRRSGLRHPPAGRGRRPLHAGAGAHDAARRRDPAVADGRCARRGSRGRRGSIARRCRPRWTWPSRIPKA